MKLLRTTVTNTLAVFTNSPDEKDGWRDDLEQARNQLFALSPFSPPEDQGLVAFFDAVIGLLDADGNPTGLGYGLTGEYQEAWLALIVALARMKDTTEDD